MRAFELLERQIDYAEYCVACGNVEGAPFTGLHSFEIDFDDASQRGT